MSNLIIQLALFLTVYLLSRRFNYFFFIVNLLPIVLYFFFHLSVESIIGYFILETIIYCLFQIVCSELIELPTGFVKTIFALTSLSLVILSTYLIPTWNIDNPSDSRVAFWNYASILFSFYTINYFVTVEGTFDLDRSVLRRNVILKFIVLVFIAFVASVLAKYIKADIAFIAVMVLTKTLIDFLSEVGINKFEENSQERNK
jgi:hypothetical protein